MTGCKKPWRLWAAFAIALCLFALESNAQTDSLSNTSPYVWLQTKGGFEHVGFIVSEDTETIVLKTLKGHEYTVHKPIVTQRKAIPKSDVVNGVYWFENRYAHQVGVTPTAFGIKKGDLIYQNHMLFLNSFQYGVSEHLSLGVGFEAISLFMGQLPYGTFSARVASNGFLKNRLRIGGRLSAISFEEDEFIENEPREWLGAYEGFITWGSRNRSLTLGYGQTQHISLNNDTRLHLISLSGSLRVSRKWYVFSNHLLFNESRSPAQGDSFVVGEGEHYLLSTIGFRVAGKKAVLDVSLIGSVNEPGAAPFFSLWLPLVKGLH